MNQEDHKLRRRLGAFAVLSAAAGAASAAAMILATPAFADPTDDAVAALSTGGTTGGSSPLDTALANDGVSALGQLDETDYWDSSLAPSGSAMSTFITDVNEASDPTPAGTGFADALNALAANPPSDPFDPKLDPTLLLAGVGALDWTFVHDPFIFDFIAGAGGFAGGF
jgi:hypothetical protein